VEVVLNAPELMEITVSPAVLTNWNMVPRTTAAKVFHIERRAGTLPSGIARNKTSRKIIILLGDGVISLTKL